MTSARHALHAVRERTLDTLRPDDIKPLLRDGLPWTPLDFLRGISREGDAAILADTVLHDIDPANDLRFVCPLGGGVDAAVCAERLPWDSSFFGYDVARLHGIFPLGRGAYSHDADYAPAVEALVARARRRGIRYLFAAVDARDLPATRALTTHGFALLETRVYWYCPLRTYAYGRRFKCRRATPADLEALTTLAITAQNPYDRFRADPFIPRADVDRLMAQWVRASLLHGFADAAFVPDSPVPTALITVKYHDDKTAAWGKSIGQVTFAAATTSAGAGYVGTLSESHYALKERGADYVFCTTQITNRSAIRGGVHIGYEHGRGEYVFRIVL